MGHLASRHYNGRSPQQSPGTPPCPSTPPSAARIDTLLSDTRVVLFMKGHPGAPQCGFSAKAVGALKSLGVPYAHVDVAGRPEIREGIKAYGDWPTIPQLYIGGELGRRQRHHRADGQLGELHGALGLPPPDRTPPAIEISPSAVQMLRKAVADAGGDVVVRVDIDSAVPHAPAPGAAGCECRDGGSRRHPRGSSTSPARAAREGLRIDWADDDTRPRPGHREPECTAAGEGMTPAEAIERLSAARCASSTCARRKNARLAAIGGEVLNFDDGLEPIDALPKDTALAFLCHHGNRSAQAAEHFRQQGFREVYNIAGGIDAWRTWKRASRSTESAARRQQRSHATQERDDASTANIACSTTRPAEGRVRSIGLHEFGHLPEAPPPPDTTDEQQADPDAHVGFRRLPEVAQRHLVNDTSNEMLERRFLRHVEHLPRELVVHAHWPARFPALRQWLVTCPPRRARARRRRTSALRPCGTSRPRGRAPRIANGAACPRRVSTSRLHRDRRAPWRRP
jgi:monothiol glutaredoxin